MIAWGFKFMNGMNESRIQVKDGWMKEDFKYMNECRVQVYEWDEVMILSKTCTAWVGS